MQKGLGTRLVTSKLGYKMKLRPLSESTQGYVP